MKKYDEMTDQDWIDLYVAKLRDLGFSTEDIEILQESSVNLRGLFTEMSNGEISDKEFKIRYTISYLNILEVMMKFDDLDVYIQNDPRGASVYVYKISELKERESPIHSIYSSIGIAIF